MMGAQTGKPGWAGSTALLAGLLVAAVLLLTSRGIGWRTGTGIALSPGNPQQPQEQPACRHWAAASRLAGSCVAQQAPGTASFPCCSDLGAGVRCPPCNPALLAALQCIAPRYMLLRPAPGCGAAVLPPPPPPLPPPQPRGCSLSSDQVAAGQWVPTRSTPTWGSPGVPGLSFQLPPGGGAACGGQRPLGSAEVPRCLWSAGFDRVVFSGDSTVRHLYTRFVG